MTVNPLYILAAAPREPARLKNFFESGSSSVKHLLEKPGELRYAGWDLQTLDTARIVKGEYLEVKNGDRKTLNLYEDGTFIMRVAADDRFLGWGENPKAFQTQPRLNPIALVELTYNFAVFYSKLLDHFEAKPRMIKFRIMLKNAHMGQAKLYLTPYGVGTFAWVLNNEKHDAPENEVVREVDVETETITKNPGKVAYLLVEKLYLWFELSPEQIPYVSLKDGQRFVDFELIKKSK
jgi:hypothetical protein